MKQTKFTPGPWRQHGEIINSDEREIALIPNFKSKRDGANARLIAASPSMYEALERCLAWADPASETFSQDSMAAIIDQMRDAIAKATGEAE